MFEHSRGFPEFTCEIACESAGRSQVIVGQQTDISVSYTHLSERSLEQAEENMTVSGKQYEVGLETLSDYLEAQVMWQQAYQTKVDAQFQLYVNYVAYLKAAGQLQ